jgi:hypothetical protein
MDWVVVVRAKRPAFVGPHAYVKADGIPVAPASSSAWGQFEKVADWKASRLSMAV